MSRQWWRRAGSVALLALLVVAGTTRRDDVAAAVGELATVAPAGIALLVLVTSIHVAVRVRSFAITAPGLSFRRAFVASEAGVAASSSLVGGGMIAAGLKTTMMRSWGVAPETIAVSLAATGIASSTATWTLAIAVSVVALSTGTGVLVHVGVVVVGATLLACSAGFWAVVLWHDGVGGRIVGLAERGLRTVRRRWRSCPDLDVMAWFGRGRLCGRRLVGASGHRILVLTLLSHILLGLVFVTAVGVVDVPGVDAAEAFTAFALVRVLATLAPLPGGLGVTELGLVALLAEAGGPAPEVLAAVMAFRACTYVVPVLSGAACAGGWHWSRRRQRRLVSPASTPVGLAAAD